MTEPQTIQSFACVDHAADPGALVRFLETVATRYFGPLNARSFELLRVAPGAAVLEAGCGSGIDAVALKTLVGPAGRVVGIDSSQVMLSQAVERATKTGSPVEFQLGDVQRLAFDDDTFDAVRSSRLLCHVDEPRRALTEMMRVLRPGGHLVAIEPDHDTLVIASPQRDCTRKIVNAFGDGFREGWSGRWLPVWCRELGLRDIQVEPYTIQMEYEFLMDAIGLHKKVEQLQQAGSITAAEASEWLTFQKQAAATGSFFSAITVFMVAGRKVR
jgi:ubiquinone/menaquinone biosynthesis C-methylase UbiE